ncbi:MAG: hypothetical protein IJ517_02235 [Alphaproteobacteria bacterium]|nr:hypothetical protein [Alphaproteobacteria bacterium]
MLTKIDLCSMALLKLGENPIQSLTDDSAAAKLSRTLFDVTMDSLVALHPWHFATQELELTKNTDGDFLIPANVLRVLKTCGRIVGNRIISDGDTITIVALVHTLPENYPSYFVSLAATRLAMEFCVPLTGNQTVFRMLVALYETELQTAKFIDSTTSIPDGISEFSLLNSRF